MDEEKLKCDVCGKEIKGRSDYLSIVAHDKNGVIYEKKSILNLCDKCIHLEKTYFLELMGDFFPDRYERQEVDEKVKQSYIKKLREIKEQIKFNEI